MKIVGFSLLLLFALLNITDVFAKTTTSLLKPITLTGTFKSKKGVMDKLSCYCYNCGYLTTADDKVIALCFEGDEDIPNGNLTVTGNYETLTIKDSDGSCGSGSREVFKVTSYKKENMTKTLTLTGTFESKKGVMTELSLYCYNCGYLTTSDNNEIALCFEGDEDIPEGILTVTGNYATVSKDDKPNSQTKEVFKVTSYKKGK